MAFRPYDHAATEYAVDGHRECRICGRPVTGIGATLRHDGEAIRPVQPNPEDAADFADAYEIVERALAGLLSANVTDADLARVAVQALYEQGALGGRRTRRRRKLATA